MRGTSDLMAYLRAKSSVDDEALNPRLLKGFTAELAKAARPGRALRILEPGAGLGAMFVRLLGLLNRNPGNQTIGEVEYTGLEIEEELARLAPDEVASLATTRGAEAVHTETGRVEVTLNGRRLIYNSLERDLFDPAFAPEEKFDAVAAHAFMDLVEPTRALERLAELARPGAPALFSLVFNGWSAFHPVLDQEWDQAVTALYHIRMDEARRAANDDPDQEPPEESLSDAKPAKGAARLLKALRAGNHRILLAGTSDWLVRPPYHPLDRIFLRAILDFMENALEGDKRARALHAADWIRERRAQARRGELIYFAANLDVLARLDSPGSLPQTTSQSRTK